MGNVHKFITHMTGLNPKFKIAKFTSDNGGEFVNDVFQTWLQENHAAFDPCMPYTQEQNGIAERAWRTLNDLERTQRDAKAIPRILGLEQERRQLQMGTHTG